MKTKTRIFFTVLAIIGMICVPVASALAAEGTITGKVTEDFQIVTNDGELYDIIDNEKSGDLMEHIGKTVKATGTISESDGEKTITVTDFTVVEK